MTCNSNGLQIYNHAHPLTFYMYLTEELNFYQCVPTQDIVIQENRSLLMYNKSLMNKEMKQQ